MMYPFLVISDSFSFTSSKKGKRVSFLIIRGIELNKIKFLFKRGERRNKPHINELFSITAGM